MTTNKNSRFDKWAYLDKDVLLRIFMTLNVVDLIRGACVCTSWQEAASEPSLWKMVDLSKLEARNFNRQPERSSQRVMDILNSAFSLSGGTISCLIFHFYVYITSQHLVLVSGRTPNLKRLVLPVRNNDISVNEFEEAAKNWPNLESLTIPCSFPVKFMKAIGKHCKNLYELKIMRRFDTDCAETILAYAPNLKVLSLRCNMVHREAMLRLLKEMKHLQVLNISHCLILDHSSNPGFMSVLSKLDKVILEEASRLEKFMFCKKDSCHICQLQISTNGILFWSRYDEGIWLTDEVSTLAH